MVFRPSISVAGGWHLAKKCNIERRESDGDLDSRHQVNQILKTSFPATTATHTVN